MISSTPVQTILRGPAGRLEHLSGTVYIKGRPEGIIVDDQGVVLFGVPNVEHVGQISILHPGYDRSCFIKIIPPNERTFSENNA